MNFNYNGGFGGIQSDFRLNEQDDAINFYEERKTIHTLEYNANKYQNNYETEDIDSSHHNE